MNSIIDYVKNASKYTFKEHGFTDADSLVLSQLSYILFDDFIGENIKFSTTFQDILNYEKYDNLYIGIRVPDKNRELLEAAAASKRFSKIKLGYYINEFDKDNEKQFSAITFKLDRKLYYVAYRGTDSTFVGWKEDFNMSFMEVVPAQRHAKIYFEKLASKFPRASFILGGHSKGGNLAVYAGVFTSYKLQKRIVSIFSHDGPGFKDGILDNALIGKTKPKIHKTIPRSSIIGMLLHKNEPYKVVVSNGFAIMQHDPFTWEIDNLDFNYTDDISELSKKSGAIIEQWLEYTDYETRKVFVDALFSLVLNTNATKFSELQSNFRNNITIIFESIKATDAETVKIVAGTLNKLLSIIADEMIKNTSYKFNEVQIPRLFNKNLN